MKKKYIDIKMKNSFSVYLRESFAVRMTLVDDLFWRTSYTTPNKYIGSSEQLTSKQIINYDKYIFTKCLPFVKIRTSRIRNVTKNVPHDLQAYFTALILNKKVIVINGSRPNPDLSGPDITHRRNRKTNFHYYLQRVTLTWPNISKPAFRYLHISLNQWFENYL